jgi:hypothetical protein
MRGSRSGGYKYPERHLGQRGPTGPRNGLGRPAWAHFGPVHGLLRSVLLPEYSRSFPFCMWALVVSFSPNCTMLLISQDLALFWLGPRSFPSSRVRSLGFLESCSLHCLTCIGLQGLVMRCLMNLSRKSCFQR